MTLAIAIQIIQAIIAGVPEAATAIKNIIGDVSAASGLDPVVVASTIAGDNHASVDAAVDAIIAALDILGYELSDEAQKIIDDDLKEPEEPAQTPHQVSDQPNDSSYLQDPHRNDMPNAQEPKQMKAELDKWMRKAISNFKAKKTLDFEFESNIISKEQREKIRSALKTVNTEEEIKVVFN